MGTPDEPLADIAFSTDRLLIFKQRVLPHFVGSYPRTFFHAWRSDQDCPMAIAFATVWEDSGEFQCEMLPMLELIEVSSIHRREGLGREFLIGLQSQFKWKLKGDAITEEGAALLKSVERIRAKDRLSNFERILSVNK